MTDTLKRHRGIARRTTLAGAVSAAVVTTAIGTPAWSQTLEEVLVTATKRTESVQDVPLAITALSGEFVDDANLGEPRATVTSRLRWRIGQ